MPLSWILLNFTRFVYVTLKFISLQKWPLVYRNNWSKTFNMFVYSQIGSRCYMYTIFFFKTSKKIQVVHGLFFKSFCEYKKNNLKYILHTSTIRIKDFKTSSTLIPQLTVFFFRLHTPNILGKARNAATVLLSVYTNWDNL